MTQVDTGPRVILTRSRSWVFTINNYHDTVDTVLLDRLKNEEYVWQHEVGESGTPHIQGYVRFKNARYFSSVKDLLTVEGIVPHIEKCKNNKRAIEYCQKDESRNGPRFLKGVKKMVRLLDPLCGKTLYPYQEKIIDIISGPPDERKIHWFYERKGNVGKSALAKHMAMNYNAIILDGKNSDIKCGIADWVETHGSVDVCILDITRSDAGYVSYKSLEHIKNGCFYNTKYVSRMCLFNTPHLIVFANFEPLRGELSLDRWDVWEIIEGGALRAVGMMPPAARSAGGVSCLGS